MPTDAQPFVTPYCGYSRAQPEDNVHRRHHDLEYGFPIDDDNILFERLILEINQAGLSWDLILKRQEKFRKAYAQFNIAKVARFTDKDRERLMSDPGVIRNRLKIDAAIENAKRIQALQKEYGSFKTWLDAHLLNDNRPRTKLEWVKLFKQTFRFTGGEIVNELLLSTGYLPGAHAPDCPLYKKIAKLNPPWMSGMRRGSTG